MGAIGIRIAGITGERRFFHWESGEEIKDALSKVVDGEDIIVVSDGGYGIYRGVKDALPLAIHVLSWRVEGNRCSACPEQGCMPHSNHGMCSLRVPGNIMCWDVASPSRA